MGVVFVAGVLFPTFVYDLFFMNLPVQGGPVEILEYFRSTLKQHALGLLGGMIWAVGLISNLAVATRPRRDSPRSPASPWSNGPQ